MILISVRVYAKEVFKKLRSFTDISEDQMLWFLNPHSRKITLSKLSEKIVSRLQIIGQVSKIFIEMFYRS